MWKDFFYFTKTERQGVIVLVVLVIGVFSIPRLLQTDSVSSKDPFEEDEKFKRDYEQFISSVNELKSRKEAAGNSLQTRTFPETKLVRFDPNTADSLTFLSLGLPPWMIKNILRYRNKQGKFRHPEDFRKIYGLTEKQYQKLSPYIHIATHAATKDTVRLLTVREVPRDTVFKYPSGTVIELNEADTTELKKIPGIGSAIARMIVNYRKRLGGFYRIEQLQEIHLKTSMLRPWFSINLGQIRRINVNTASIERMMHHPYINFYQARIIAEYRKKKGRLKNMKQLSLYDEFLETDFEHLEPYICYD